MKMNTNQSDLSHEFGSDHVAVSVSSLGRSVEFYERNFGFRCERVIGMPEGARWPCWRWRT
jgi:catechol 2,3-dioxygenase-like lactoylglutathione lyase family enzyme